MNVQALEHALGMCSWGDMSRCQWTVQTIGVDAVCANVTVQCVSGSWPSFPASTLRLECWEACRECILARLEPGSFPLAGRPAAWNCLVCCPTAFCLGAGKPSCSPKHWEVQPDQLFFPFHSQGPLCLSPDCRDLPGL